MGEYFEWADVLHAVESVQPHDTFVFAEVGARDAAWGVRVYKAGTALGLPSMRLLLVEPDKDNIELMRKHLHMNRVPESDVTSFSAAFGRSDHDFNVGLAAILCGVDHADLVDIDAQGSETIMAADEDDARALREKVYRI